MFFQCCGSGSGRSVKIWPPGSGSVILITDQDQDQDQDQDPYYLSKIQRESSNNLKMFMFRDKSIVSHHVETHLGKKQERSMLYSYRILPSYDLTDLYK